MVTGHIRIAWIGLLWRARCSSLLTVVLEQDETDKNRLYRAISCPVAMVFRRYLQIGAYQDTLN